MPDKKKCYWLIFKLVTENSKVIDMSESTEVDFVQMFKEEREKLLKEVQELVKRRKELMGRDPLKDYNFYKRRTIGKNF